MLSSIVRHWTGKSATMTNIIRLSKKWPAPLKVPEVFAFAKDRLWVGGSYGESFGYINTQDWTATQIFKGKYRNDPASQGYAGMAYDGDHIWIAWHWCRYNLPASQTQLLLKIDPE